MYLAFVANFLAGVFQIIRPFFQYFVLFAESNFDRELLFAESKIIQILLFTESNITQKLLYAESILNFFFAFVLKNFFTSSLVPASLQILPSYLLTSGLRR